MAQHFLEGWVKDAYTANADRMHSDDRSSGLSTTDRMWTRLRGGAMADVAPGYYSKKLAADRLQKVYEIASPRVQQYLDAEIQFVLEQIQPEDKVLELGCGYGRVLTRLAAAASQVFGIDTSLSSLQHAKTMAGAANIFLASMNAVRMAFNANCFDLTVCIQNGISAFKVNQRSLIKEAARVTRPEGKVLFSSYAAKFWPHRLDWFRAQADCGLVGEIDEAATGNGVIVCKDGFKATTLGPEDFRALAADVGRNLTITTVDDSSVFCDITVSGENETP
jgi:2-polyprenyl-6-hydroxyphenyl methylase/3-demethylubiquinone-9 3-methyltransferase